MASLEEITAHRDRWLAVVTSGDGVAEEAYTALEGCRAAIQLLEEGLHALGYPVSEFLTPCPPGLERRIQGLETATAIPVPEVIVAFWKTLGGVSLVDLEDYAHVQFWAELRIEGARQFCDGLHVDACGDDWVEMTLDEFACYHADNAVDEFRYELAPDGYHKDDISGGPAYAVGRNHRWAPAWLEFDWTGYRRPETAPSDPPDFLSYLRTTVLECAGFPGLLGRTRSSNPCECGSYRTYLRSEGTAASTTGRGNPIPSHSKEKQPVISHRLPFLSIQLILSKLFSTAPSPPRRCWFPRASWRCGCWPTPASCRPG